MFGEAYKTLLAIDRADLRVSLVRRDIMGNTEVPRSMLAPAVGSILCLIAWLVFILYFALYWSNSFSVFQNVIVTIVSLIITGLVIGLVWLIYGAAHSWKFGDWK